MIQTTSRTIVDDLSLTLLQFIMVLFAVEILTTVTGHFDFYAKASKSKADLSMSLLRTSVHNSFNHMSRVGLLFSSCYLLSLGILYAGNVVASIAPTLGDVSLYVVIVSISLALLIIFKEDQK